MTRPEIEPWSPGPLANTQLIRPMVWFSLTIIPIIPQVPSKYVCMCVHIHAHAYTNSNNTLYYFVAQKTYQCVGSFGEVQEGVQDVHNLVGCIYRLAC